MKRIHRWLVPLWLVGAGIPAWAGVVRVQRAGGAVPVYAEDQDERVMVDIEGLSVVLGSSVTIKDGDFVVSSASGTAVINPQGLYYRVQSKSARKWEAAGLSGVPFFSRDKFMVSLEDVPRLFQRPFTYHLQRRVLSEAVVESDDPLLGSRQRRVTVRHTVRGQKDWVSVEDVARELGVVIYASQAGQYTLVMHDFTFLELRVGEPWVYKKHQAYKPLSDPILSISGSPHATPAALSSILEAEIQWDAKAGALRIPRFYGRLKDRSTTQNEGLLRLVGYQPRPLSFKVDELSAYYQTPGPSYSASPSDLYESVRDFLTNRPLDPHTDGYDQWSGEARLELEGSLGRQPIDGGVRLEKIGTRARVADGQVEWGFPRFKVRGGRELTQMGDLDMQLETMDQVSLSHSSDHFGEGRDKWEWKASALYGQTQFFVFTSTDIISQAIVFRQKIYSGGLETLWRIDDARRASLAFNHYAFLSRDKEVSTEVNFPDDLLGDDFDVTISSQAKALTASVLTDRHDLSMLEAGYTVDDKLQLFATAARSSFRNPAAGDRVHDDSWRLRTILGNARRKLTLSHQRTGAAYRSIGDPLSYKGRYITRLSPYWEFSRIWRAYGEFRREDGEEDGNSLSYRNDNAYMGNSLSFRRFSLRHRVLYYDYQRIFRLYSSNLDSSIYFGRDSLETGVGWSTQLTGEPLFGIPPKGTVFKQSYSARLGYQILRPDWKFSMSQDAARNHYPRYAFTGVRTGALDKWETSTQILAQRKSWETSVDYGRKPRNYREPDYLYTGTFRLGWQPSQKKILNAYYAASSLRRGLASPEVWRIGLEYANDFY